MPRAHAPRLRATRRLCIMIMTSSLSIQYICFFARERGTGPESQPWPANRVARVLDPKTGRTEEQFGVRPPCVLRARGGAGSFVVFASHLRDSTATATARQPKCGHPSHMGTTGRLSMLPWSGLHRRSGDSGQVLGVDRVAYSSNRWGNAISPKSVVNTSQTSAKLQRHY